MVLGVRCGESTTFSLAWMNPAVLLLWPLRSLSQKTMPGQFSISSTSFWAVKAHGAQRSDDGRCGCAAIGLPWSPIPTNSAANCGGNFSGIKILYTGGIHPAVQLDRAIEAIPLLKAPGMLYIVGPGQDEYVSSLKVLSTKLGCQGSVVFSGVVPRGRLRALASGADIGLAFYDNSSSATLNHRLCSPNKVYEYMAAGLPTVCSANATLVDLVEKRGWGFCADTSDIAAVARAIDRLASDAELRNEFKRNAGLLHQSEMNCEVQYAPIIALL